MSGSAESQAAALPSVADVTTTAEKTSHVVPAQRWAETALGTALTLIAVGWAVDLPQRIGWSLFTDDQGDLYALGNAWFGFGHFFDRDPSRQLNDCLLRIQRGSRRTTAKAGR